MLRQIEISQLCVDMFVAEILADNASGMPRKKRGMIRDPRIIEKFKEIGISSVVIDTQKGLDVAGEGSSSDGGAQAVYDPEVEKDLAIVRENMSTNQTSLKLEWKTARAIFETSVRILNQSYEHIRGGKNINPEYFAEAASAICRSVLRNKDALTWLGKIRDLDSYIYEHSVNTAVLMGIFCHARGMSFLETEQCVSGALLHDLGQVHVRPELFSMTGPLSETEFEEVREHVRFGDSLLNSSKDLDSSILHSIIAEHHERIDGSGYPNKLKGEEISIYGKMFAIVDSYDALTNNRSHKDAVPSSYAMKVLLEEAGKTLDESLVHLFIKSMGVYPTGSLVKLSNDTLGVVIAQTPDQPLKPLVKLIYSTKTGKFLIPQMLNLSTTLSDIKILSYEDPRRFDIDPNEYIPEEFEMD